MIYSIRIVLENGVPVAWIEPMGACPRSGVRVGPGEAWAAPGTPNTEVFAVCNEAAEMPAGAGFKRVGSAKP